MHARAREATRTGERKVNDGGKAGGYGPSIQVARLFRKTSAKGTEYFTGRWGAARVTLLKSRDMADDGSEIWHLLLAEAPPPPQRP